MKKDLKEMLASKVLQVLEDEAVAEADKTKVISCAYNMVKKGRKDE